MESTNYINTILLKLMRLARREPLPLCRLIEHTTSGTFNEIHLQHLTEYLHDLIHKRFLSNPTYHLLHAWKFCYNQKTEARRLNIKTKLYKYETLSEIFKRVQILCIQFRVCSLKTCVVHVSKQRILSHVKQIYVPSNIQRLTDQTAIRPVSYRIYENFPKPATILHT